VSGWQKRQRFIPLQATREEFRMRQSGFRRARVLNVDCGLGVFRPFVPAADYTGIDPHVAGDSAAAGLRAETLQPHRAGRAG
jgi:hypothetical protein